MERNDLRARWRDAATNADWNFMCDVASEAAAAAREIPTGDIWEWV